MEKLSSKGRIYISSGDEADCFTDNHFLMTLALVLFLPRKVHLIQFKVLREGHITLFHSH
jgi:hypothetical protein